MKYQASLPPTLVLILIGALVVATGCDSATSAPEVQPEAVQRDQGGAAARHAAARSTVPALTFGDMEQKGTSQLVRTSSGVSFRLSTTGLEPGTVHTLWMVIFNQPENCVVEDCGADDLFNADANPDLAYGAGIVIGSSGRATFAGHRTEGDNTGSIMQEWLGLEEPGLVDAREAEIHFVVHSHGPKIPGLVDEMLHTFNAGCGPEFAGGFRTFRSRWAPTARIHVRTCSLPSTYRPNNSRRAEHTTSRAQAHTGRGLRVEGRGPAALQCGRSMPGPPLRLTLFTLIEAQFAITRPFRALATRDA
jgi:hypothetical protein